MLNMVREKVVMELLEIIINTELIKQPKFANNKHQLTGLEIFSSLSAEITKYPTRRAITRLKFNVLDEEAFPHVEDENIQEARYGEADIDCDKESTAQVVFLIFNIH